MPTSDQSRRDTRQRVLESACVVFAEKGFHDATVQEICERAEANIASVNYYFRDKESLYGEVWRHAYEVAEREHGFPTSVSAERPLEEQLHAIVLSRVRCIFDDGLAGCFPRLLLHELVKPSAALEDIVMEALHPAMRTIHDIVAELLGPGADSFCVRGCTMSVIAQFAHINFSRPLRELFHRVHETQDPAHEHPPPGQIARHITDFSLAGIRYYREQIEKQKAHDGSSE